MTDMKLNNIFKLLLAGAAVSSMVSCHNREQIFPPYEGGITAYFAYQYPVRTIVLGESETFETTLDNQHKCIIYGAMGGDYEGKDIVIDIKVDNTLADNMYFEDGSPVKAMPESYYKLGGNQLVYGGNFMGGVEVQLTDAFFADPDALKNTYVIPVVMDKIVKGADQIADGEPLIEGDTPIRTNPTYWNKTPMDYTLYCIKYINEWDGSWLRRGVDQVSDNGTTTTNVRHEQYVENDEVTYLKTNSLKSVSFPVSTNVTFRTETQPGYALKMSNPAAGEANWSAQVWYQFDTPLTVGKEYTLTCRAKASQDYNAAIFLQCSGSDAQQYGLGMNFTTEWTEQTLTFRPDNEGTDKIAFNFGDVAIDLFLDDVSCVMTGTEDQLIPNGDFEDGTVGNWTSWSGLQTCVPGIGYYVPAIKEETRALTCDLLLTFSDNGDCTVTSATEGITASGSGKYVKDGEKLAWGNRDRDGIYLEYNVDFGPKQIAAKDTLVSRSREITLETYVPTYKE